MERRGQRSWFVAAVARGLALFFGLFTIVNVVGALRSAAFGFDANVWWVAVPLVGRYAAAGALTVAGLALAAYALRPEMGAWRRGSTLVVSAGLAAVTAWNGVGFYGAWRAGEIQAGVPLPLSFVLCAIMVFIAWAALRAPAPRRRWGAAVVVVGTAAVCALLFPLAQVFFFGETDYRREASVAVVFGAQVHPDGHPSTSLSDRMNTAVDLYQDGLVNTLLVSGGVGDSGYNEAEVMRDMAIAAGVAREDVVVDGMGMNTEATVSNSIDLLGSGNTAKIIAVSQFYHLPRIKLAYARAGRDVLTVPAVGSAPIVQTPRLVAREIPAFWVYYLRAVIG